MKRESKCNWLPYCVQSYNELNDQNQNQYLVACIRNKFNLTCEDRYQLQHSLSQFSRELPFGPWWWRWIGNEEYLSFSRKALVHIPRPLLPHCLTKSRWLYTNSIGFITLLITDYWWKMRGWTWAHSLTPSVPNVRSTRESTVASFIFQFKLKFKVDILIKKL